MSEAVKEIPPYVEKYYWWAYARPWATRLFERQWLINLILLGNYIKLRDATLEEFRYMSGNTLQISCCYGNLTPLIAERILQSGGTLDVIDVLPVQLENLQRKMPPRESVRLFNMDSTALRMQDARYDRVLVFFLMHEQPQKYREKTLHEALRVLKPGGTIVIVDYSKPSTWNPVRYLVLPILGILEPFAIALWNKELAEILPEMSGSAWKKTSYFGGLFQKLVTVK